MIGFIIGATLGTILGFTACALLTVDKVKPRLPDNLKDVTDSEELQKKALEYLRQMNPPPICKDIEHQVVNLEILLAYPFGLEPVGDTALIQLAEEFGRTLLQDGHLLITEHKDGINMETTYRVTARVLKPKEGPDQ